MSDPADMEILAAAEHESWGKWTRWMLSQIEEEMFSRDWVLVGALREINVLKCVKRWKRQHNTPYADLSEGEKESDRKVVREKLKAYRPGGSG